MLNKILGSPFCPVQAYINYIGYLGGLRPPHSPLLVINHGAWFQTASLGFIRKHVDELLEIIGLDSSRFSLHSMRRSGALVAKMAQIDISHIKSQGTWKSDAIWSYIGPYQYLFSPINQAWKTVLAQTPNRKRVPFK